MYIACKKCKYKCDGDCGFYEMGNGNEIDMPCYREKEMIKEAADNFLHAFVGAESEENELRKYEVKVITRGNCIGCGKELTEGLFFCKECEEKGRK